MVGTKHIMKSMMIIECLTPLEVLREAFCHYFATGLMERQREMVTPGEKHPRKPGRPRAIPKQYESVVVNMYDQGDGYRAIARRLREPEYGLNPDHTTVRRTLIRLGKVIKGDWDQKR